MWNRYLPQVSQGAILLDSKYADWHERIDTSHLQMRCPHNDILGQLYGDYEIGVTVLFGTDHRKPRRYGFCLIGKDADWNELRESWLDAILLRKIGVACISCN